MRPRGADGDNTRGAARRKGQGRAVRLLPVKHGLFDFINLITANLLRARDRTVVAPDCRADPDGAPLSSRRLSGAFSITTLGHKICTCFSHISSENLSEVSINLHKVQITSHISTSCRFFFPFSFSTSNLQRGSFGIAD